MRQEISTTQEEGSSQAMKMEQYYKIGCEPDAESEEYTNTRQHVVGDREEFVWSAIFVIQIVVPQKHYSSRCRRCHRRHSRCRHRPHCRRRHRLLLFLLLQLLLLLRTRCPSFEEIWIEAVKAKVKSSRYRSCCCPTTDRIHIFESI